MKHIIGCVLVGIYVFMSVGYAADVELETAVSWMYENGLTKFNSVESFDMSGNLTREQAAKFFTNFGVAAIDDFQGFENDNDCNFSDISSADYTLIGSIQFACKLGIFKGSQGSFYPQRHLTQGQAVAVAIRLLIGIQDEDRDPRYAPYFDGSSQLQLLKGLNISSSTADNTVTRADVAKLLYRIHQLLNKRQESVTASSLVYVSYIGKFEDGTMFDTNIEAEARKGGIFSEKRSYNPLGFIIGGGAMIDGFAEGVVGMKVGQTKIVTIPPSKGYGDPKPELLFTTGLVMFYDAGIIPEIGESYSFGGAPGIVTAINGDQITLDFNHELAGKNLIFTITVLDSYSDLWSTNKISVGGSYISSGECDIKGNINRDKKKIYHYPGCKDYTRTKVTEAEGEKWFCSEKEATDAGWIKAENC